MSTALLKELLFGKNFSLHGPADFLHLCDYYKKEIEPGSFSPLVPLTGGVSLLSGDDRGLQVLLFGSDWLAMCREVGADTKNAVLYLASHFDDHAGIAALSLELAMIAMKEGTNEKVMIDFKTYADIVNEIFVKNYAGIQSMSDTWGIGGIKEGVEIGPKRTRTDWRDTLNYDVLLHPATLEPCRDDDGSILEYDGTVHDQTTGKCSFLFTRRAIQEQIHTQIFPAGKTP
ncbi:hypothetical protein EXS57_00800 [Candidatus Kaiserbacteria bacterium]|nr:hypothetical protein [Candidatus Kaiserbacteria bacterium]